MSDSNIEIETGHNGAGEHCDDQLMRYGGGAALGGACLGAVEGCFLNPVPGQTSPLIFKTMKIMGSRSLLFGFVGATFAAGACWSAKLRDKDDYKNAFIGGALAGLIFGYKSGAYRVAVGLRAAVGMGIVLGITKFRNGTYLPPLIPQEESYEVRRTKRLD